MSDYPADVVDEEGHVFMLEPEPIGRGGQGVVFRTGDPDIAVKFIVPPGAPAPVVPGARVSNRLHERLTCAPAELIETGWHAHGRLRARLEDVRVLPLPRLHIARPLSLLRTYPGYTMQLLRGMVPIRTLIAPPGTTALAAFYREGGGLRRRLHLLAGAASLLLRLHGVPVVYADVSPANVFVSASPEANEVWLIDADNLQFESLVGSGIHTLGYGAPELVQGAAGVTTLSDAWSFAVLAYQVLTQVHPFIGDYVDEGGWDEEQNREDLAFAGKIPWIGDPSDPMNGTQRGIYPREMAVSPKLSDLFARMFGPGRMRRTDRPTLASFSEAFRQAGDLTLACPSCGWTFFVKQARCSRCPGATRPAFLYAEVRRVDALGADAGDEGSGMSRPIWHAVLDARDGVASSLRRHVVSPTLESEDDPVAIDLQLQRGRLLVTPRDGCEYWLADHAAAKPVRLDSERPFHVPTEGREIHLHCGPLAEPHRLLSLRYWDAER